MALGHPGPTTLFQEASCSHYLPHKAASLDSRTSQVQQGSWAPTSRSYLEVPSIREEKHVPNSRRVWLLWSLSEGGSEQWKEPLQATSVKRVPAVLDFPWDLPSQPQFSYLS